MWLISYNKFVLKSMQVLGFLILKYNGHHLLLHNQEREKNKVNFAVSIFFWSSLKKNEIEWISQYCEESIMPTS